MADYTELLKQDVRFIEGLKACINCGVCTAICPAAGFYNYDPRKIITLVQSGNNGEIENLMKSDTIWYCGECMSCKTRCPRGNTPAFVVMALRNLSQKFGFFTESEKGRQQFAIKRSVGENIFKYGYCVAAYAVRPDLHREQGPVWEYIIDNSKDIYERMGCEIGELGEGPLRKIPEDALQELKNIFDVTGGTELLESIEKHSRKKAAEMNLDPGEEGIDNEYFNETYTSSRKSHSI